MARRQNKPYRDPELVNLRREYYRSKLTIPAWAAKTRLSESCLRNIAKGITRHPQHYTVVQAYGALGYRFVLLKEEGANVVRLTRPHLERIGRAAR